MNYRSNYGLTGIIILAITFFSSIIVAQESTDIIQNYLFENQEEFDLEKGDFSDWIISKEFHSKSTNVTHVYINQMHNGLEIVNGTANFNIRDAKVYSMGNRLVKNISQKANAISPTLSPQLAIQHAAEQLGIEVNAPLKIINPISTHEFLFDKTGISLENIPVKLVYQYTDNEEIRLSWDLSINTLDAENWWSVRVDAETGEIISKNNWVTKCDFESCSHENHANVNTRSENNSPLVLEPLPLPVVGSYNVFAIPTESPTHGPRITVQDPEDLEASPFGWHDDNGIPGDEYAITRGNNVHAYEDLNNNNNAGASPDGGAALNFNFIYDGDQPAQANLDAATTNLFYMNNIMHDVWYQYGFDEASGNFQEENYTGTGGFENDYVRAEAQDGGDTNNANFSTPADGTRPRMQMYLWTSSESNNFIVNAPPSDESLDVEYANSLAGFGPDIPTIPLTADLVLVTDETGGDPNDACEDILNGDDIEGKIAVIRRGECEFGFKILAAEDEGAVAVIIVNNVAGGPVAMGAGALGSSVTIPSLMLSSGQGEAIIDALANGDLVNGTIVDDSAELIANDSSFDNGIIAHEYGHGISIRLTGGANNSNCLSNDEQMGEGWSDWFGIMLTMLDGDLPGDPRGVGTYAIGQATNGNGIRPAPYSTDPAVNDFTYGDTNNDNISQPHGIGFVWATILWDLNWALIEQYGFDSDVYNGTGGNNIAMQLVIDGLKLQPCGPGFVDGRDAILEADMLNYGGIHQCLIWQVFANRGLGASANQGSASNRFDQTQAFDIPDVDGPEQEFEICQGETIEINGNVIDAPGTYEDVFTSVGGCDSVVTSIVTFSTAVDVDVDVNTLIADNDNVSVSYQWVDCQTNNSIDGATNQSYNPDNSGEYAVIVTENECAGMSDCITFNIVGIEDFTTNNISISPNPTSDILFIDFGSLKSVETVILMDSQGKVIYNESKIRDNNLRLDLKDASAGIYMLHVSAENGNSVYKVVVE
ncbi:MAG: extracellular elastinolytic metalloproteinase [Patiriisocius sp.]|jgi:extracellular elastinolytic metalloproteinase